MILKAPADGTISLISVWHSGTESPFKAGGQVWSGAPNQRSFLMFFVAHRGAC